MKTARELIDKHYPLRTIKPLSKLQIICIEDAMEEYAQQLQQSNTDTNKVTEEKIKEKLKDEFHTELTKFTRDEIFDFFKPYLSLIPTQEKQPEREKKELRDISDEDIEKKMIEKVGEYWYIMGKHKKHTIEAFKELLAENRQQITEVTDQQIKDYIKSVLVHTNADYRLGFQQGGELLAFWVRHQQSLPQQITEGKEVEFAEWLGKNKYIYTNFKGNEQYWFDDSVEDGKTTTELYQLFTETTNK